MNKAMLDEPRGVVVQRDQPEEGVDVQHEGHDNAPQQRTVLLGLAMGVGVLRHPLHAQRHSALDPTLLGAKEALWGLGHAERQLPVDEVRVLTHEHSVERAGSVLDLATCMELLSLDKLRALLVVPVTHTLPPSLPHRGFVSRRYLPHTVGTARADAPTAIPNHCIEPEELGIVVVQVVVLVLILRVVLGRLRESDAVVQDAVPVEEAGDTRDHEVGLVLVACVGDRVQGGSLVLRGVVQVLRPLVDDGDVVIDKVQAARLSVTGPQWNLIVDIVIVALAVNDLVATLAQFQPLRGVRIGRDLVVPRADSDVLHHHVPRVLVRLRSRREVHAQRGAVRVRRQPVPDIVEMRRQRIELVVVRGEIVCKILNGRVEFHHRTFEPLVPAAGLLQDPQRGLPTQPVQHLRIELLHLCTDQ
mmetsp:Transcript_34587/g.87460  ORF Transcript_34587/g.87460 Transcript_34587/m.87460 type:complete len:416 (+) Transcript_34587:1204-2451(+)